MTAPRRILVVDDDKSVAITIQAVLQQEGYEAEIAPSIPVARDLLAQTHFDAALVDLRIDDGDGIDLVREIHAMQPHCSAIILTGYASLESTVRAIRQGAYDYLIKPCDLEELKLTIARAVERSVLRRDVEARVEELQQANDTISALNRDLECRIAERTEQLVRTVDELAESQARLEQAHKERLEFVAMIAHELGQPLTTILGSAQLLARRRNDQQDQERVLHTIVTQSQRLRRLQRDLADVARLSTGRFEVEHMETDLAKLVTSQVEAARQNAALHTIAYDGPLSGVSFLCDPDRVEQVITNLLGNALKYTPGGAVRVTLAVNEAHAEIGVSDEGPGIPPDRWDAIFQPHVRLHGKNAQPQGAGLGLYIARGIAEAHGGELTVGSAQGGGSIFTLTLPVHASEMNEVAYAHVAK